MALPASAQPYRYGSPGARRDSEDALIDTVGCVAEARIDGGIVLTLEGDQSVTAWKRRLRGGRSANQPVRTRLFRGLSPKSTPGCQGAPGSPPPAQREGDPACNPAIPQDAEGQPPLPRR